MEKITKKHWNTLGAVYAILVPALAAMAIDTHRDMARWDEYERKQQAKKRKQEQIRAERQALQQLEDDIERFEDEKQAKARYKPKQKSITKPQYTPEEIDLWQRMVWSEMRGQSRAAQIAIANTPRNRLKYPKRYGSTIKEILLSGEYRGLKKGNVNYDKAWRAEELEPKAWERAQEVVAHVLSTDEDITNGSTHYENITHKKDIPYWATNINANLILHEDNGAILGFYDRKNK